MRNSDAIELARLIHRHAASGVSSQTIDRILSQPRSTRTIRFDDPVELTIRYDPIVVEEGELRIFPDLYGYSRHHVEGVFQALIGAGYDVNGVEREAVRDLLARAQRQGGTFAAPIEELFPTAAVAGQSHSLAR